MSFRQRLLFVDDVPTPYRLDAFRLFAERFEGAFRVLFCADGEQGRAWNLDFDGLDASILPGRRLRAPGLGASFSLKWNPAVRDAIRAFDPTAMVVSGYVHPTVHFAAQVCRERDVPLGMACESSFLQRGPDGVTWRLKRRVLGPFVRSLAFALPCGSKARDYLAALGGGERPSFLFPNAPDARRLRRLTEGVRSSRDARARLLADHGVDSARSPLLFVGRLESAKRPLDALAAFARLPARVRGRSTLLIVGDGSLRPALEHARAAMDDPSQVVLVGWVDPETAWQLMAASTLMVLPSELEAWGAVVNESMAVGTPVLASDRVGSAYDLVEDGRTGWIVPVGAVDALADRMGRALGDPELAAAMRDASTERGARFDAHLAARSLQSAMELVH